MKTMIAFGIPPSGKKYQILRRTIMPDGEKPEVVARYAQYVSEMLYAKNVRVIVREVTF